MVTKKKSKIVVKVTDKNSGIAGIGIDGMKKITNWSKKKRVTSYTVNVTKANCKRYSYYRKHGFGEHIGATDRTGNFAYKY